MMNIQEWFCICLFFKLYLVISDARTVQKSAALDKNSFKNIDKESVVKEIDDLIDKFVKGHDFQSEKKRQSVEEDLPDKVIMTQGYTTISEYIKSWLIPGYQPEAYGTAANPLVQHTFQRIHTADGIVPMYGATTIAPTDTPYVKESAWHLHPDQVIKSKKGAKKIVQEINDSEEKVRLA